MGIIAGIIIFGIGALLLFRPDAAINLDFKLFVKDGERSKLHKVLLRIMGGVAILIGIFVVYALTCG